MFISSTAKLHKRRRRVYVLRPWLEVGRCISCPIPPIGGTARTVEIGICSVVGETLRSLVGIGAHVCVGCSGSGGERGRVCRRATLEGGVVVV